VIEFVGLIGLQRWRGEWWMTWDALRDPQGNVSIALILTVVIVSPVLEEAIFRVLLLCMILRRSVFSTTRRSDVCFEVHPTDPRGDERGSKRTLTSTVAAAIIFGVFHLLNAMSGRFSPFYIVCQV